jgi:hypothetical protein
VIFIRCSKFETGRASVMAILIGSKTNSGQVSVCGDAYGRSVSLLEQHLALFVLMDMKIEECEEGYGNESSNERSRFWSTIGFH